LPDANPAIMLGVTMSHADLAYNYCALPLAAYACRPDQSRGRLVDEPQSRYRTPFQRDRDRIIHTGAFRRLKYKTQVFVYHEGDHYRTRLSHTIEVAQIARTIARALMVNEDLAEGIALAHDLGHTPFAHIGEDALSSCMENLGGFDHNDQSLRILTTLERRYPEWDGLNLSWEVLEGVAKHNGPVLKNGEKAKPDTLPIALYALSQKTELHLDQYASLEAQVAALADDIAYNNHDVEDGLRAGFFTLKELAEIPMIGKILTDIQKKYPDLSEHLLISEMVRDMIGAMVEDVLETTSTTLKENNFLSPDDIRQNKNRTVSLSSDVFSNIKMLREFLFARMYRHYTLERIRVKVDKMIPDLFSVFMDRPSLLPQHWQKRVEDAGGKGDEKARARIVCDYIAGMTDRYAIREHERIFDLYWDVK
jgi:dGTPase